MRRLFIVLALASIPAASHAATPEEVALARKLSGEGTAAFRAENYQEALTKFREANRLVPHPNLDVNIGRTYEAMGQPDQALVHCKIALNAAGTPEPTRQAARTCLDRVTAQLARPIVTVTSRPNGAEVRVDGSKVGRTPWRGGIEPGRRQIDLELDGYRPATESLNAERGATHEVDVVLIPASVGGRLSVASAPSGALVYLDDELIGETPVDQFQVGAQSYKLEVRREGFASEISVITVEDGEHLERVVSLIPVGGVPKPVAPRKSWPGWALVGVGVATVGLGSWFGVEAIDSRQAADKLARTSSAPDDRARYDSLHNDFEQQQTMSDVFIVAGGALVAGGITWLVWPDPADSSPSD